MRSITTRFAGLAILVGGIWGGLVPFVGPYFHYSLGPTTSWTWTTGRLYLSVLPAIAAVIGGLLLLRAGPWPSGRIGASLALVAGIWFVVGPDLSYLWQTGGAAGVAHGSRTVRALEPLGYHTGLGVLIAALAAYSLPGLLRARAVAETEAGALAGAGAATAVRRPAREPEPADAAGATTPATGAARPAGAAEAAPVGSAGFAPATADTEGERPRRRGWFGRRLRGGGRKLGGAH
jgi:hypothetical protein